MELRGEGIGSGWRRFIGQSAGRGRLRVVAKCRSRRRGQVFRRNAGGGGGKPKVEPWARRHRAPREVWRRGLETKESSLSRHHRVRSGDKGPLEWLYIGTPQALRGTRGLARRGHAAGSTPTRRSDRKGRFAGPSTSPADLGAIQQLRGMGRRRSSCDHTDSEARFRSPLRQVVANLKISPSAPRRAGCESRVAAPLSAASQLRADYSRRPTFARRHALAPVLVEGFDWTGEDRAESTRSARSRPRREDDSWTRRRRRASSLRRDRSRSHLPSARRGRHDGSQPHVATGFRVRQGA